MNNKTFIEQAFFNNTRKDSHGNLFRDGHNNIYSYGYHYPLLFRAEDNDNLYFINTTGYSNTTSKHIGHAWAATDYKGIAIELNGRHLHPAFRLSDALTILSKQLADLKVLADSKKRKDTQVYARIEHDIARVTGYIERVNDAIAQ
jgi:hypothetical protein